MTATEIDPTAPPAGHLPDPRPVYRRALEQTGAVLDRVTTGQLGLPTPCSEYDVELLVRHVVFGVRRAETIAGGGDPLQVPDAGDVAIGQLVPAYRQAAEAAEVAWAPDERLEATVWVPWGRVPGRQALWGYVMEVLVHGWDVAAATGQPTELDLELGRVVLAAARVGLPREPRGAPHIPFGPVVDVPISEGVYAQLAGWVGRRP